MIERSEVIQQVLRLFVAPAYLEIAVDAGDTSRSLSAGHKVIVDPNLRFAQPASTPTVQYQPVTSDEYFGVHCKPGVAFDVVYIDGLHVFEQVLRDLMNSIMRLKPGGIIIVDDVLPASFHAAMPNIKEAFQVRDHLQPHQIDNPDNTWMGDVYKLVFFVETFMQQLSYATVSENHGQMVLWKAPRPAKAVGRRSFRDVALLDFSDTVLRRDVFRIKPFNQIMSEIAQSRAAGAAITAP